MIAQVAPNIYSIPIPLPNNPLKSLNAYLVKGAHRSLLIDTGFRMTPCRTALLAGLAELGVSMENTDIFLTHLHSDHSGLAPEIASPSTKIFVPEVDCRYLPGSQDTFSWERSDAFFLSHGFPAKELKQIALENPAKAYSPAPYDHYLPLSEGAVLCYGGYVLETVFTPGHTPGHMCLYARKEQLMFLGDHVLFDITPNITAWEGTRNALGLYLQSLQKVAALPVKTPMPAHRQVGQSLTERVADLEEHHRRRCGEVVEILRTSPPLTAYEIAARMTWKIRCKSWADFPLAQKWFAVGEAIAHLEYLEDGGLLTTQQGADGIFRHTGKEAVP